MPELSAPQITDAQDISLIEIKGIKHTGRIPLRYFLKNGIHIRAKTTIYEYYQCTTKLGHVYLEYYLGDRINRMAYLRKARSISRMLSENWKDLGKARSYAGQLRTALKSYGQF